MHPYALDQLHELCKSNNKKVWMAGTALAGTVARRRKRKMHRQGNKGNRWDGGEGRGRRGGGQWRVGGIRGTQGGRGGTPGGYHTPIPPYTSKLNDPDGDNDCGGGVPKVGGGCKPGRREAVKGVTVGGGIQGRGPTKLRPRSRVVRAPGAAGRTLSSCEFRRHFSGGQSPAGGKKWGEIQVSDAPPLFIPALLAGVKEIGTARPHCGGAEGTRGKASAPL